MDQRIAGLKPPAFPGRRLTRRRTADGRETAALFPNGSRSGPAKTVRQHPGWRTAPAVPGPASGCRGAGGPRHPDAAAEAGGQRPRHEGRRQAGLDPGLRPAAGDRRASVRPAPAARGARERQGGAAAVERARGPAPLPRLPPPLRGACPALRHRPGGARAGLRPVRGGDGDAPLPGPLDRMDGPQARPKPPPYGREPALSGVSLGCPEEPCVPGAGHGGAPPRGPPMAFG